MTNPQPKPPAPKGPAGRADFQKQLATIKANPLFVELDRAAADPRTDPRVAAWWKKLAGATC